MCHCADFSLEALEKLLQDNKRLTAAADAGKQQPFALLLLASSAFHPAQAAQGHLQTVYKWLTPWLAPRLKICRSTSAVSKLVIKYMYSGAQSVSSICPLWVYTGARELDSARRAHREALARAHSAGQAAAQVSSHTSTHKRLFLLELSSLYGMRLHVF